MCDPTTMIVATLATAGVNAYGQIQAGQQARAAGERNAQILEQRAAAQREQTAFNEERTRARNRRAAALARVGLATSGVAATGTPLSVAGADREEMELDALTVRWQGELEAQESLNEAETQRFLGRQAASRGVMGAIGTLATGALSAGGVAYKAGMLNFGNGGGVSTLRQNAQFLRGV